jgi:hypothetical protein
MPKIYLAGLDANATYRLKRIDNKVMDSQEAYTGSYLMNEGVSLALKGDYDSTSLELDRAE